MQHRLRSPPCLIVEIVVLREAARVHRTEVGTHAWPTVRAWFTAIVESSPDKSSRQIFTLGEILPPFLRSSAVVGAVHVISAYVSFARIVAINSPSTVSACGLSSYGGQIRKSAMKRVQIFSLIIEALHVYGSRDTFAMRVSAVHCNGDRSRRIESMRELSHRFHNSSPSLLSLHSPFFVS